MFAGPGLVVNSIPNFCGSGMGGIEVDKARGSWGSWEGDDLGVVLFCSCVRALMMDYELLRGWVLEECDLKWIMKQVLIWFEGNGVEISYEIIYE